MAVKKINRKYKINRKRLFIFIGASLLLLAGIVWGIVAIVKHYKSGDDRENQPQVYEALVMVTDQTSSDPVEDARANLKAGDVIAYFPEGHPWSETERISYLIVKVKLKPDEAIKLTEAQTKEVKREESEMKGENGEAPKDMGLQMETVRARAYRLDLPSYDVQKFWETHEQPFSDKIFDEGDIEKKKELK